MKKISTLIILIFISILAFPKDDLKFESQTKNTSEIHFFPNPLVNQPLQIVAKDNLISEVHIFNILGQPVFSVTETESSKLKLDINIEEKGMFLLQVKLINGEVFTDRLIIK